MIIRLLPPPLPGRGAGIAWSPPPPSTPSRCDPAGGGPRQQQRWQQQQRGQGTGRWRLRKTFRRAFDVGRKCSHISLLNSTVRFLLHFSPFCKKYLALIYLGQKNVPAIRLCFRKATFFLQSLQFAPKQPTTTMLVRHFCIMHIIFLFKIKLPSPHYISFTSCRWNYLSSFS